MSEQLISVDDVLARVPQQAPFRYIDTIVEIDDEHIIGQYTYKMDEGFYRGHFPSHPVTPGVILLETMAQTGVVAFGIYLVAKAQGLDNIDQWLTMFTDAEVEFCRSVGPGETVTVKAEKIFWRRMKLKVKASLYNSQGDLVATSNLSGIGVKQT